MVIGGCLFKGNKSPASAKTRGCVSIDTHCVLFQGRNEFIDNQVLGISKTSDNEESYSYGGSLFIRQEDPASYFIRNMIFTNSYCRHYGGAIGVFSGDHEGGESEISQLFVTIENCVFTNCTAGKHGGAIKCGTGVKNAKKNNDVKISNCEFSQCYADIGGCLFFTDGTKDGDEETVIEYCRFDGQNKDRDRISTQASALYTRSYKFEMRHTIFENYNNPGDAEPSMFFLEMNENEISPVIENVTFYNNEQFIELQVGRGTSDTGSGIDFIKCNFTKNNQDKNGEQSILQLDQILSQEVRFESCIFDQNGGQCIRQGVDPRCNSAILNCNFTNNHGIDGCAIYTAYPTEQAKFSMVIGGCLFKGNKSPASAKTRGCVSIDTHCVLFNGHNEFIDNEILGISGKSENDESYSCGGSLFIRQEDPAEYFVTDVTFTNSYSKHYGGAIGVYAGDYEGGASSPKQLFITITKCVFNNCTSYNRGGAIKCGTGIKNDGKKNNDVKITYCVFNQCDSMTGGSLFFSDGTKEGDEETVIEYCQFNGITNTSLSKGTSGSAIYCRSYKFELSHSTFTNYKGPSSFISCILNENNLQPKVTNCTFSKSEQRIDFESGEGVTGTGSSIIFSNCHFTENTGDLENGLGVIQNEYIKSEIVTFDKCVFDKNKGQSIRQGDDPRCNTFIVKCNFTNNVGTDGCAIYVIYPYKKPNYKIIIQDCLFMKNRATGPSGLRGCVRIDTHCVEFRGHNQFISNEIILTKKAAADNNSTGDAAIGGSLFINQEDQAEYTLSGLTFTNSYSGQNGGAIGIYAGDYSRSGAESKLFISVYNCVFNNCSCKNNGGAICGSTEGKLGISSCSFNSGKAENGADIYYIDTTKETPSNVTIRNCYFSNGQATNAGGAIYSVADSVFVDFCNFTGCNAKTNGAIMFIESQSNFSLENNIINYSSNAAVPAISYNGTTENATIWFDGGCISKSETSKNHFISLYSNVTIQFKSKPCFQGSKEDTFEFAANANVQSLPDEYFNCHECDNIVIVPPSINPTDLPFSPTLDPNATAPYQPGGNDNKKKKKGLSTGAIVGIVIGVIAFVALVAVGIILLIIWKKRNPRDVRSEQVSSQEVETGIYNLGGQSQSDFNTDNNPIWQATNDINDDGPEDPFMKNFEESDI
ncbi:hypothetical protein M9Y10_030425 [Tritrichomonas musculus]|uniref:Right handed beta helix domain-containing protein n=1 Tax=Tritrichomonas musculus TaxID=1915356 RepID=A0ABR2H5C5_9EUKA